jgi:hypothetical protein
MEISSKAVPTLQSKMKFAYQKKGEEGVSTDTMEISSTFTARYLKSFIMKEEFSQYSDGLRAGRPGFDSRLGQEIFFYSPQRPDQLWGTSSLLFNGYRGALPQR